jgi:hypothetical protein
MQRQVRSADCLRVPGASLDGGATAREDGSKKLNYMFSRLRQGRYALARWVAFHMAARTILYCDRTYSAERLGFEGRMDVFACAGIRPCGDRIIVTSFQE